MLKKLFYTSLLSILCAYILITRQYFYDWSYYLNNSIFKVMMVVTVLLLWVYIIITIIYNIFMVYMPWSLRHISKQWRQLWYFLLASVIVFSLHLGQLEILFKMRGFSLISSGYMTGGMIWFMAVLFLYLSILYCKPQWNVFNTIIWNLFKGGLLIGQQNFEKARSMEQRSAGNGPQTTTEIMILKAEIAAVSDNESMAYYDKSSRVMVYHVLLFYFSRKEGSFFIDTDGNKWFCNITSSQLSDLETKDWFVKINKNTYLNMWYFEKDELFNYAVLLDPHLASQWPQQHIDKLQQMLIVSERCRPYFRNHFDQRNHLPVTGWGQFLSCM